jgi:hypothetical protein
VGGTYGTNWGGEDRVYVIGMKTGGKETKRETNHRWLYNIKMELAEIGCDSDWIRQAKDRYNWRSLVNLLMYFGVP